MSTPSTDPSQDTRLKIGAVANSVGVSVHTIRKWEERYGAVNPARTPGGGRTFTVEDLDRLVLIKRLADAGHSLRELAQLSLDQLTQLWADNPTTRNKTVVPEETTPTVAVLGARSSRLVNANLSSFSQIKVVATASSLESLSAGVEGRAVDVVVIDSPVLTKSSETQTRNVLSAINAKMGVIVYDYATRVDLALIQAPNIHTLRAPSDAFALERAITAIRPQSAAPKAPPASRLLAHVAPVSPARYSDEAIMQLVERAPTIACECPQHIAELLAKLRAFEDYSENCENRNEKDAALHRYLWRCAAQARTLFESALERVVEHEGLDIKADLV